MLELIGIKKSFGKITVLHAVDLSVRAGEIHALLGENGAGKSTLMKVLCGILKPSEGEIRIEGKAYHFASYHEAIERGIGVVFQEFSLTPYLNAVENIFLARELCGTLGFLKRGAMRRQAARTLQQLGINLRLDVPVCRLSVAEQQFVEIAKALSLNARILVLDEPTATLTPAEVEHLFKVMRNLREQGVAIIFISHHLEEIFAICDRVTVLRDGQHIATCGVDDLDQARLVEMMVGRKIEHNFPAKPVIAHDASVVLDVEALQLTKGGPLSRFQLRASEILGFAGLVGSGRTETVLAMLGALPAARCQLRLNNLEKRFSDPADALSNGLGLLPESRKEQGLVTRFSILQNVLLNNYGRYLSGHFFINRNKALEDTRRVMRQVAVKARGPQTPVDTLSGGNQQKVVIARWLNHSMQVLIFDEPTRGIDVGAKAEIYQLMREYTAQGHSIIMISSQLPEVIGMSDRVCVFASGAIVATLEGAAMTSKAIMTHATSGRSKHVA